MSNVVGAGGLFITPIGRVEGYEYCSCPVGTSLETGQWVPPQLGPEKAESGLKTGREANRS